MSLNEICKLVNRTRRQVDKLLPRNEIGKKFSKEISKAIHNDSNYILDSKELRLILDIFGKNYNIRTALENEITKVEAWENRAIPKFVPSMR